MSVTETSQHELRDELRDAARDMLATKSAQRRSARSPRRPVVSMRHCGDISQCWAGRASR